MNRDVLGVLGDERNDVSDDQCEAEDDSPQPRLERFTRLCVELRSSRKAHAADFKLRRAAPSAGRAAAGRGAAGAAARATRGCARGTSGRECLRGGRIVPPGGNSSPHMLH